MQSTCPVCDCSRTRTLHHHTVEAAAQHFIPRERSIDRHAQLVALLVDLWGSDGVDVRKCDACGFGFSDPFVGGSPAFYNLVTEGDEKYPEDRWEFGRSLRQVHAGKIRALEIGAGDGAFVKKLRLKCPSVEVTVTEYDEGSKQRLRGLDASVLDNPDLSAAEGEWDVVVAFQTLEHVARIHALLRDIRRLLAPRGRVFVSVPNGPATDLQERITGLYDMPPNHVGRWTKDALSAFADRNGFTVEGHDLEPMDRLGLASHLAYYRVRAGSSRPRSPISIINGLEQRSVRGPLRAAAAAAFLPGVLRHTREFQPLAQWVELATRTS